MNKLFLILAYLSIFLIGLKPALWALGDKEKEQIVFVPSEVIEPPIPSVFNQSYRRENSFEYSSDFNCYKKNINKNKFFTHICVVINRKTVVGVSLSGQPVRSFIQVDYGETLEALIELFNHLYGLGEAITLPKWLQFDELGDTELGEIAIQRRHLAWYPESGVEVLLTYLPVEVLERQLIEQDNSLMLQGLAFTVSYDDVVFFDALFSDN